MRREALASGSADINFDKKSKKDTSEEHLCDDIVSEDNLLT